MCKFSIFLHSIISLVSHSWQVPYIFTFHYIFSVPLYASSLLLLHFIIFLMISLLASTLSLCLIISFACHYVQVPYLFTFYYIFSVPFWASSLSIYVSLFLQCPIMCKFTIFLRFIIYLVSHYVQVHHLFTFHYIFSVPFWASTLQLYVSLFLQCPIMCKFTIFLRFIIYLVSHYVQVPYHFMFHYIFSVPLCASSLLLLHFIIFLMVSLLASTLSLRLIISFACHYYVQVPYLFTFHYIFSVPFWASSLSFYISLDLQCPIMCKFSIFLNFITFIIMCKFPIFLHFIISLVSHSGQVPYNFVLHYIFSVPLCASSLSFYLSLFPLCPIMCKYPIILCFIISSVSHYVQVPYFCYISLYF